MIDQSTNTYINGGWCAYRLPCGICEKLERECLKKNGGPTITWTSTNGTGPTTITYSPVAPATSFGEETV